MIHGRNEKISDSLFEFLHSLGLHPLEWEEIVNSIGKTSPFVSEVIEQGFEISQCIIVLLTPDDEARLKEEFRKEHEPSWETELTGQSRLNVIFEAGMAMGKFPERTIIVELGNIRPYSDIAGRHVIKLDNSPEKRNSLASRLESAGCSINRNGDRWISAGNFVLDDFSANPKLKIVTTKNIDDQDEVKILTNEGFFDNRYKKYGEIIAELKNQAKFIKGKNYRKILEKYTRESILKRKKIQKQWGYIKNDR